MIEPRCPPWSTDRHDQVAARVRIVGQPGRQVTTGQIAVRSRSGLDVDATTTRSAWTASPAAAAMAGSTRPGGRALADPAAEVGQGVVRRGPVAVREPVGEPHHAARSGWNARRPRPSPAATARSRRRPGRSTDWPTATTTSRRSRPTANAVAIASDERAADDDLDVVQPVAQHRHRDAHDQERRTRRTAARSTTTSARRPDRSRRACTISARPTAPAPDRDHPTCCRASPLRAAEPDSMQTTRARTTAKISRMPTASSIWRKRSASAGSAFRLTAWGIDDNDPAKQDSSRRGRQRRPTPAR